jgi:hypothetical protein
MPKYINNTSNVIVEEGYRFEPNGKNEIITYKFLKNSNLTKISDDPNFAPVLYSDVVSGDTSDTLEIDVPLVDDNSVEVVEYIIDLFCLGGSVAITYNTSVNKTELKMVSGDSTTEVCKNRRITKVIIEYLEDGTDLEVTIRTPF